jgi:hypothetical protein
MNFDQAYFWTAFLSAIVFWGYCFYMMIRKQRDKKGNADNKKKKQEASKPKPTSVPAYESTFVKADFSGISIVFQVSDIKNSNVEVANITNRSFNSEPASVKREQKPASSISPADNSQCCNAGRCSPPKQEITL